MESVFKLIRLVIAGLVIVPMLWAASCAMLGVGTVYAVKEAAEPLGKSAQAAERRERERRERLRRRYEAGYGPPQEGDDDY